MRLSFAISAFSFAVPEVLRSVALKRRHKRYVACDGVVRGNMPKALKAFGTAVSRFRLRFNRLVIHTAFFIFSAKPRLPILHMDYPQHPTCQATGLNNLICYNKSVVATWCQYKRYFLPFALARRFGLARGAHGEIIAYMRTK